MPNIPFLGNPRVSEVRFHCTLYCFAPRITKGNFGGTYFAHTLTAVYVPVRY